MKLYYWSVDEQGECIHYAVFAIDDASAWEALRIGLASSPTTSLAWVDKLLKIMKSGKDNWKLAIYPVEAGIVGLP